MILLCIDDDPEDREFFCDAVKSLNPAHTCMVARSGHEALEILNVCQPDLIFLDINMPIMDGKQTLQKIRSRNQSKNIPICIFSTTTNKKELDTCIRMGATQCLIKPNTFLELCNTLRPLLVEEVEQ
jgi:CheY-like chemotaxis protein